MAWTRGRVWGCWTNPGWEEEETKMEEKRVEEEMEQMEEAIEG